MGKHYKFVGTPFGLKHVPSVFQKVMGKLFADLNNYVFVYVDDIIIYSSSFTEHTEHVRLVIERLNTAKLKINIKKTILGALEIIILGHAISSLGIQLDEEKLVQFEEFVRPTTSLDAGKNSCEE